MERYFNTEGQCDPKIHYMVHLDDYHQKKGYLLSFNFNKKKEPGVKEFQIDGKTIIEAIV